MLTHFTSGLLFAYLALPGVLLGDLVFRCPSCTAERLAACPKVTSVCGEIVREPGCGCCPVCARMEGELCGVYTPRCSTGFRCYPNDNPELPLQQLIKGLGRCVNKVDMDAATAAGSQDSQANEVHGTEGPPKRPPPIPLGHWTKWTAVEQHQNEQKKKMKIAEQPTIPRPPKSCCEQELDKVLEEIAKMTFQDNRGPLENLYELRFPNCDRQGLYNVKQCNMSTHGQRGECWCVDPSTGVQIAASPKIRGDPNCNQFRDDLRPQPTAAHQCNSTLMSTHGHRGECWCVDRLTGVQMAASPKIRGDPNCKQFQDDLWPQPTATTLRR